jgi:threonyl-tRNA synthetase
MEVIERDKALDLFRQKNEPYKIELINDLPPDATISLCRHGEFVDLCRGGHVESTGLIKALKLTSVAGAYWRGDEKNKMLQRIYGTAFSTEAELKEHLHRIEEAKKRDHRKLGKELDLFSIDETIGGGLVLWHPKGARVRYEMEEFWRKAHLAGGYDVVFSPHVARDQLWKVSGHLGWYKDNMYSGMEVEGQQYLVKPMNCPYHITMFKSGLHSYRQLPFRWAELGTVYRYERSGVLHGLLRVRGFTQDDSHLFMRRDQVPAEIDRVLAFCLGMLRAFGFTEFKLYLATRPKEFVGEVERWDEAEALLLAALKKSGLPYEMDPGGGAFYGPKIDLKLLDSLGREWQCSTIQVDFNLPERFDLTYVGEDGKKHRAVMLHRALLGSIERFFAVLVEHYAGAFPAWLAPVQARVVTVSERHDAWAHELRDLLVKKGIRADADDSSDKLGAKIRRAQLEKVPFTLVVGDKEVAARGAAPRTRDGKQWELLAEDALVERLRTECAAPDPVAVGATQLSVQG